MKISNLILFVLVSIVATKCASPSREKTQPENKVNHEYLKNAGKDASKIIAHTIDILEYIDNKQIREAMNQALDSMVIIYDTTKTMRSDHFMLVITTGDYMRELKDKDNQLTLFNFDVSIADSTHQFVIRMNKDVPSLIRSDDAKSCMLIHELIHAMQANNKISAGKKATDCDLLQDEVEAWNFETDLYFKIHPNELTAKCDCNTLQVVKSPLGFKKGEWIHNDLLVYKFCGEKYLRVAYTF